MLGYSVLLNFLSDIDQPSILGGTRGVCEGGGGTPSQSSSSQQICQSANCFRSQQYKLNWIGREKRKY